MVAMFEELEKIVIALEKTSQQSSLVSEFLEKISRIIINIEQTTDSETILTLITFVERVLAVVPENKQLQTLYGQIVLNTLPILFVQLPLLQIKAIINNFRAFADKTTSDILTEFLGMILVNSIYDFSLKNHAASINEFATELIDLSRKHPTNEKVQTACAKGLFNATQFLLQQKDRTAARNFYRQLETILETRLEKEVVDSRQLLKLKEVFEEKD